MSNSRKQNRKLLLSGAAAFVLASLSYAPFSNAIVPNDSHTPEDIVDDTGGVNGVGMFIRGDGFVCSGTLINPRTVLFAAHCVNDRAESDYGTLVQSAWSFDVDASELINFLTDQYGATNGAFTQAGNSFLVNQIWWNSESTARPDSFGYLEGDIALASLATPAANIPTWALLFSRLPDPTAPGEDGYDTSTGTGYHVDITGYGRTGDGTTGDSIGIDFRRRAAENMLGSLSSFDNRNTYLFGDAFGDVPQNLYRIDFDDPSRTSPFDFDLYQDAALNNEGITAGGDSGGPLILDAANNSLSNEDLVIGVLSGGSRFFGPQVFSSYGTESFFQPLFLYADYIAANNPYRYVSAIAGDGAWEDATHWQTDLDPNYRIIDADGNVVNGFPDTQPFGRLESGDTGFGTVCFDPEGDNIGDGCLNFATGDDTPPSRPAPSLPAGSNGLDGLPTSEVNGIGDVSDSLDFLGYSSGLISLTETDLLSEESETDSDTNGVELVEDVPLSPGDPLPAPTVENGLAGATNFVPDNIDPAFGVNGPRRYFEVTLSNEGTTTLSSTRTIDRLNVAGEAGLIIDSTANLMSLMDVNQFGGRIAVDGVLSSVGDYSLFAGMLSGSGTINTPFLTNIAGIIAPGSIGTTGTLTVNGSAILSSGSRLLIDIGANGTNDELRILGDASLGGQVVFNPNSDVRAGNTYTFLTTTGSQSGEFTGADLSSILRPVFTYKANSVVAMIEAGTYNDAIVTTNKVQEAYAKLLDASRGTAALDPIYATLDLSSDSQIQGVLDSWAPVTETTTRSLAKTTTDNLSRFHRNRLSQMRSDNWGGGAVTVMGNPVQMASNAEFMSVMSDSGSLESAAIKTTREIPDDYAIYLSGTFIDGKGSAMPTAQNFSDEDFDGWAITAGIEHAVSESISVGASLSYTELEADASLDQHAESEHIAGPVDGQLRSAQKVVLDGQFSVGSYGAKTSRTVAFPSNSTLESDTDNLAVAAEVQVSRPIVTEAFTVVPKVGFRNTVIAFDDVQEAGGLPALHINREVLKSTQGRIGLELETNKGSSIQARLTGDFVQEFASTPSGLNASFAGGPGANASFLLFGTDKNWAEVGAGIDFNLGTAIVNLSADTTVGRKDIEAQSYRAGVSFKF